MNRQAMAALRARLQQKIAQNQPLTAPESLQDSGEEKEAMSNTAVLDDVETLEEELHEPRPAAAVVADALLAALADDELSEEEEDDEVVGDVPAVPAAFVAPEPRQPKARPRRKRHVVGRIPGQRCEILYLDVHDPVAVAEVRKKYDILPGVFKTRAIAEWYVDNAGNLHSVKCASDAAKAFKADCALIRGYQE